MKILNFFLIWWVIFALLDPDPEPNPQPWFYAHMRWVFKVIFCPFYLKILILGDQQNKHYVSSLILAALSDVIALISSRPLVETTFSIF